MDTLHHTASAEREAGWRAHEREARADLDRVAAKQYVGIAHSSQGEAEVLLGEVRALLMHSMHMHSMHTHAHAHLHTHTSQWSSYDDKAKMRAIQSRLGILPDGTAQPLTTFEHLRYANPRAKLVARLQQARKRSSGVVTELGEMREQMSKDIYLLQIFVLE